MTEVTNRYWYPEQTPPDTAILIQRPSPFGNPFQKGDGFIAEYVVAQYWIYIFSKMKKSPEFTASVMELYGKDLVCSCKNKHKWKACHGDPLLYLIERNAKTDWKVGLPIQCDVGIEDYHTEIYQKCLLHTGTDLPLMFGVMETDLDVSIYVTTLKNENRHRDAAFYLALWSLLLTHLYNEGRNMYHDEFDYCAGCMAYYMGTRDALPSQVLKRQPPRKSQSP